MGEPPGLRSHGGVNPGGLASESTSASRAGQGVSAEGPGAVDVEPLHLLVQGMRQLQQAYIGKGESRDSELKGAIELPSMPELTADSAVSFSDWLYETEQAVGGLSDRAAAWFTMCLTCAREAYELYQTSDPLVRLTLEPVRPEALRDENGRGLREGS